MSGDKTMKVKVVLIVGVYLVVFFGTSMFIMKTL